MREVSRDGEADGDGAHRVAGLRDAVGETVVTTSQVVDELHAGVKVESTAESEHDSQSRITRIAKS